MAGDGGLGKFEDIAEFADREAAAGRGGCGMAMRLGFEKAKTIRRRMGSARVFRSSSIKCSVPPTGVVRPRRRFGVELRTPVRDRARD